jgi:dihydroxyacetone kinase-like protein
MPQGALLRRLMLAVADRVIDSAEELTRLDQAIGDGDHGLNMKRGFEAVRAALASDPVDDCGALLLGVGRTLVMKVGGASGPLYGSFFLQLGKDWKQISDRAALIACLRKSVEAVASRGKSHPGQKTMLDVLFPLVDALPGVLETQPPDLAWLRDLAAERAQATIPMLAERGRASFLKERSIGHMDPGAASSSLMVAAACEVLDEAMRDRVALFTPAGGYP